MDTSRATMFAHTPRSCAIHIAEPDRDRFSRRDNFVDRSDIMQHNVRL
jgi:hypothetical protein